MERGRKPVVRSGGQTHRVRTLLTPTSRPIDDDGESDVAAYNAELTKLGPLSWLKAPWLFAECYLFRRMSTYFRLSTHWQRYDPFARQKIRTFRSSRPAVLELAARYRELIQQLEAAQADKSGDAASIAAAEETLFTEMCEICLWGNATDLSLLTNLTYEDIQKLQGAEARRKAEANILVNDLPTAYKTLTKARDAAAAKTATPGSSIERRVDIVLDNAGFELYVDLILAGYLLRAGLATNVVLHPKNIPWFVSDVLPSDFAALLNALASPQRFYETPSEEEELQGKPAPEKLTDAEKTNLSFLFGDWTQLYANGQIVLRPNIFWTQPGSFWRLPNDAPELYDDLKTSELVIFKGDLNYRKLTSDVCPPPCLSPNLSPPLSFFLLFPLSLCTSSNALFTDRLGCNDAVCRGYWPAGPGLGPQRAGTADVQGRCSRRSAGRQGRGAPAGRGRWR